MSLGFGFSLPALVPYGAGGNNPFNQAGPTLDLSFAGVVTDLSDPNGYTLNTNFITPQYQIAAQYVVWETGVGLVDKTFSQIITFSRASGATWFNSAGNLIGVDFSTSSNTIGTGSKTFTLTATAGVDRSWATGDSVLISDQANSANNMTGTVTSYTASTQVLVVNVTSTGGSGTIASWRVGSTMPRLDYNPSTLAAQGFLVEEARTNLLQYSEDFGNAAWTKVRSSVTADAAVAPNGASTGDKLVEDTQTGIHSINQAATVSAGAVVSASAFFKAAERNEFLIILDDGTGVNFAQIGVVGGVSTVTSGGSAANVSGSVTPVGNGWFRVVITCAPTASYTTARVRCMPMVGGSASYTGDGTSGLYVWGAQLEAGAFPTSYIPTTTTALTRSADVASVNTLAPWFNATEGTFVAFGQMLSVAGAASRSLFDATDGGASNRINGRLLTALVTDQATVRSGGSTIFQQASSNATTTAVKNFALAYKASDFAVTSNGSAPVTQTSGVVPVGINQLQIGQLTGGTEFLCGYLRRITYYPRRLSNAELQAITA